MDFELREIRKNHYVKVVDGIVVGKASIGDVYCYKHRNTIPRVDAGMIETSIALSGILGIVATYDGVPTFIRLVAGFAFTVALFSTNFFTWNYIVFRMPNARTAYINSKKKKSFQMFVWEYFFILFLLMNFLGTTPVKLQADLGYAFFWVALILAEVVGFFYVFMPVINLALK